MTDAAAPLPRLKPDPIPRLHPVPEYAADAELTAVYEDTKHILQVPWMGVVTMAFAHYPTFWATLWEGIRPAATSAQFLTACESLRATTETLAAGALAAQDLRDPLLAEGYGVTELDQIRALIEVFSHGNMPYIHIASVARLLLEDVALDTQAEPTLGSQRHGPAAGQRLVLMERHHADAPTRALYDDLQATLGLPFVNTDYRALARWPSYFAAAWADLKPRILSPAYAAVVEAVHAQVLQQARALPNPTALTPQRLQAAAAADAPLAEVLAVVRLFQWLLPGLVTNVAILRAQLGSPPARQER